MANTPLKIVYITPAIYSAGGVERVITLKASYFAEQYGYDVTIIVTEGKGRDSFFPLSDKVKVVNLAINFEKLWTCSFIQKVFVYLKKQHLYKQLLSRELQCIRPDITISTLRREINFINDIADGSKKIGELHVNRSNYRNYTSRDGSFIKHFFARFWMNNLIGHLKQLDRMVVLTETAKGDWPELSNVTMIPDPLPFKVETVSPLSDKRVINIGRYAYEKGNDLLLRIWAKVQDKCNDWVLDIYGVGDPIPYRHLFRELGIDDRRCHLYDSLIDVQNAYLNSSLFALASRFEGFSLVAIEAMACGVPVVSFDCEDGPRNIITDGKNGYLIPPFDIDAYAERLLTLMQNEDLRRRMGSEARQASCQYQVEDIALRWKILFEELTNKQ